MRNFSPEQSAAATETLASARAAGLWLVTAESCTGGLIAACLTDIAGSSDVIAGGFVTYSNDMKSRQLGVPTDMLETHGAVSAETAAAMASGALDQSGADIAVAVTGIAGPGGGSPEKPVGLVWFGIACQKTGSIRTCRHLFEGDRVAVRNATLDRALALFREGIAQSGG